MAGAKWIKITSDIFDDEKMYAIETMQDGYLIELIWFKLLCIAGKCNNNGFLIINNKIPYTDEMLANAFRMEIGTVQRALALFQELEMIELVENTYMISNWLIHQNEKGLEDYREKNRERQKRFRDKQKQNLIAEKTDSDVSITLQSNVNPSLSISNSYSYSNNSNINNLNYLLEEYEYKETIENNPKLKDSIIEWMEYKDARKPKSSNHYGTEVGIKKLLNLFVKNFNEYGSDAVASVVDYSISNNYAGLFWDKVNEKKAKPKATGKKDFDFEDYLRNG